jgi:hypothetical protein
VKSRRSLGAPAQRTWTKHAKPSPYRPLPPKIKAAVASDQGRSPRPITLPPVKWLERELLQ